MQDALAWVGGKLYVPASQRLKIVQTCHDSKLAGHFVFIKSLHLLKIILVPSLQKDIESYVSNCPICAITKWRQEKTPGLLQTVAELSAPWR